MLCLATVINNFMWVKITHICFIRYQKFVSLDLKRSISFQITVLLLTNNTD